MKRTDEEITIGDKLFFVDFEIFSDENDVITEIVLSKVESMDENENLISISDNDTLAAIQDAIRSKYEDNFTDLETSSHNDYLTKCWNER